MVAAAREEGNEDEANSLRELQSLFSDIKQYALARWDAPKNERSMAMRFMMHFMDLNSGETTTMHAFLGNEVQHLVPYLGNWFEPHLTQDIVRRALNFGFRNADWGLYGNDDLGATSSFYVWGALGIYPAMAGVGGVTLVAPSFSEVDISLPDGRSVKLLADKESMRDRFVRSMTRDGRTSSNLWISAQELLRGTELVFDIGTTRSTWGQDDADAPPSYSKPESPTPTGYGSIWREEGDDGTGASSHSAFDADQQSAWHFVSETDGSKVLEVDFTSVYAASGLLLRHADVGRTSTFDDKVSVSVAVKDVDGNWNPVKVDRTDPDPDTPRMLLDFDAGEVEIHGLRLTFGGLDVDEEHGIYEVLAKDGRVVRAETVRSQRSLLEKFLGDGVRWLSRADEPESPVLYVDGLHEKFQITAGRMLLLSEKHISVDDAGTRDSETGDVDAARMKFRVADIALDTLYRRTSLSGPWVALGRDVGSPVHAPVYTFSLADLRAGKIGIMAGDGTNAVTFTIQAVDSDRNLSDSDSMASGEQPAEVTIPVVALQEVVAGYGGSSPINADGAFIDAAILNLWRDAAGALTIFVDLKDGKSGLSIRDGGVRSTADRLVVGNHGVAADKITTSWDARRWRLSLVGTSSATRVDFQKVLHALQLRTVFSATDSYRTISVHPYISGDVSGKDFHVRDVKVVKSPQELILEADFARLRVGWRERLVLREDYMPVTDIITMFGNGDLDPARITFRVTISSGGSLQRRASASGSWAAMTKGVVKGVFQDYYAFTLADVRAGRIAFLAGDGVAKAEGGDGKKIIFQIQAADSASNAADLSDSDRSTSDPDPESVSLSVVARKEIDAGKEMPVNDDRRATSGDGTLTPSDATLDAWIDAAADSRLKVLVRIEGTKRGETLFLEDGHDIASIASSWSWDSGTGIGILSLQSDGTATVDDFQAVLNALVLRTVRSDSASIRTISVRPDIASFRPDIAAEVPQKDYYVRKVLVRESRKAPYVGVQKFLSLKFGQDDRAILSPSEFLLEDFDTSASGVTIVMRELSAGATLQRKDGDGVYRDIERESDGSLEFTLEDLRQGLMAIYLPSPLGEKLTFELEARDSDGRWSDIGTSNTHTRGVQLFTFDPVRALSPEELETDLETGHQRAVPFGGLEKMIEEVRSSTDRTGVLSIELRNAVPGDRLVMRKSVSGIGGDWSDGGQSYTLTVYLPQTTNADIAEALAEIYYRASESAGEKERELVVRWVASTDAEVVLFTTSLANRPPVLRNWGMAARYHDITPAPDGTETFLDLGYHPFREYMPDILDNEGKVLRLEVLLLDKAHGVLSADERVFLPQQLQDEAKAQGLVLRELRSSDQKAHALVIEFADGKTPVSPEFMSRILQGLSYRHGADGRDGDVGERREISVAVFDGEVYSQTLKMEVRLVDSIPDPAKYVNTFIGTAELKRMGVAGLEGNKAGMSFPGAAYPFGMIAFSPDAEGKLTGLFIPNVGPQGARIGFDQNGGYRRDGSTNDLRFGLQYLSGPGCPVAGLGQFKVGVSGRLAASDVWSPSDESSAPGYYQVGVSGGKRNPADSSRINVELATGTARTGMMRLTYDAAATGGWIDYTYSTANKDKKHPSITSVGDEWIVQFEDFGMGICNWGYMDDPKEGYWMQVSFHIKKEGIRNIRFIVQKLVLDDSMGTRKLFFDFDGDNREVLAKVSMSYISKENARENLETENPGWDFDAQKEQGRKAWNYYLSKVAINDFDDANHDKSKVTDRWSIFYSALYRSLLHMDVSSDVNGDYRSFNSSVRNLKAGNYYDYGPYGEVGGEERYPRFRDAEAAGRYGPAQRVRFTNFSGWDVYRSQMALVGLLAPAVAGDMAQSLVHTGVEWRNKKPTEENGIPKEREFQGRDIPRWTAGEKEWGVMSGDPGPPSVSSLYFFSQGNLRSLPITLDVFDYSSRWVRVHSELGGPRNVSHHANRVMEGMAADAAISQFAFRLSQMQGLPEEIRQQAWELYRFSLKNANDNLEFLMGVSPTVGKNLNGYPRGEEWTFDSRKTRAGVSLKWDGHLDPEGNPIQYSFMPNHNVQRLKEIIDDAEKSNTYILRGDIDTHKLEKEWDKVIADARAEGNEDEVLLLGDLEDLFQDIMNHGLVRWDAQDERSLAIRFLMHFMNLNSGEGTKTNPTMHAFLGNEVQHSVPYLGNWFEPQLTQDVVRRALNFGFRNADWGLYGNDDLGATSAFYVWGALGIYPVIAGVGGVTLVTPSFREGEISLPDGRSIKIRANKESMRDRFVNSMTRDGRASSNLWISAQELVRGTELVFDIGTERTKWGQDGSDAPPSYSTAESRTPTGYGSIWLEEGDDGTGASSHSAFDGDQQSAWHFVSESDGSKVLEVEFTSVYAASGLLLRHADVGRTSTFNDKVSVSVSVKGSDGSWIDVTTGKTVHDVRRMLLDFDAGEVEIHGLRLTFEGLDVNEEHGIYEVLAKGGRVVERARLRSQRSLLEGSLGDGVSWREFSPNPVLSVGGLHERFQATAGLVLVLGESHISVKDLDTWVPETGDAGASRITLRVRGVVGGVLQERTSLLDPWVAMDRDDGSPADAPVYSFSLADLRADKIGFLSEDGSNDITFTIQAEDDEGHLSDSDSVRSGDQPSSVRIPVVGLVKVIVGEPSSVNSDGALTPDVATLNRWRGAAGALTILVELHRGENIEELLLGSHGVTSIVSSWSWDPERKIGTLSLQGSSSARASDFRSVLGFLQLRSAVGVSEGYRRILVRPDISGSAFRKDFHVREVKVYVNDAPEASKVPDFSGF